MPEAKHEVDHASASCLVDLASVAKVPAAGQYLLLNVHPNKKPERVLWASKPQHSDGRCGRPEPNAQIAPSSQPSRDHVGAPVKASICGGGRTGGKPSPIY